MNKPMPMLAKPLTSKVKIIPERYVAEEKYDGIRLIVRKSGQVVDSWTRLGTSANHRLSAEMILELVTLPDGVYDGELHHPKGGYSSDVTTLANRDVLRFTIFDILELLGNDVTGCHLAARRSYLEEIFGRLPYNEFKAVFLAPQWPVFSHDTLATDTLAIWERGGEGVIVKDLNAPYRPGKRDAAFLKLKQCESAVLTIIGFAASEGEKENRGPFGMTVLQDSEGVMTVVKTLNDAELLRLSQAISPGHHKAVPQYLGPFYETVKIGSRKVEMMTNHPFVGRELRIEYQMRTPDGSYRHPRWDRYEDE